MNCEETDMNFFAPEGKFPPAGMFTPPHLIALCISFVCIAAALFFSKNIKEGTLRRITLAIAVTVTLLECVKITYKFAINHTKIEFLDGWMPLFYCSLFIYTTWMALSKNPAVSATAASFIAGGGIVGGLAFLICPSTSLMLVPAWHFLSIHSMLYHSMMVYLGFLYLLHGKFIPGKKTFLRYIGFLLVFMIPCQLVNILTASFSLLGPHHGSNLMLLSEPLNMPFPFIYTIYDAAPWLYPILVMLVYIFIPFGVSALLYKLFQKCGWILNESKDLPDQKPTFSSF